MLITSLTGGDRRSIGAVHSVVAQTLRDPSLVQDLVTALRSRDPVVPMRAADALEKISRHHSDWLIKYRARLLQAAANASDPAVRWNLIQIFPQLPYSARTLRPLARRLEVWFLNDDSAIVRACALDALVKLSSIDARLIPIAQRMLADALTESSAAVRARARKLKASMAKRGS